jgi:dTDP-4-dehydrorhamnose reductase
MRILLLGNTGQVGWELHRTLLTVGDVVALDYPQVNMADAASIRDTVRELEPAIIINATAYTNVDKAEEESTLSEAINGTGPGILAEEAQKLHAAFIHFSTDYVFDGEKGAPYTEKDEPNPINQYGLSKLHGEQAVQQVGGAYLVFRTAWVYSLRRPCFVTKLMEWAKTRTELRVVDDQISNPTWSRMLAEVMAQIIAQGQDDAVNYLSQKKGLYHLAGGGTCSRYEWAKKILEYSGNEQKIQVQPASSDEFPAPAKRPAYCGLDCTFVQGQFSIHIPEWSKQLQIAFDK